MRILITGGAGSIGSNFVHYWLAKYPQDSLTILDKLTYSGHQASLSDVISEIKFIQGDICDADVVDKAMSGQDIVIHFAAETHVDRSIMGPDVFIQTNIVGTQILLEQALKHRIKLFHHVSTDEVFGHLPLDRPDLKFSETTPYNPSSPYSAAKAASDFLVRAWHITYGLPVTITNTSNNYGPFMDPEKFIPRFIINILEGKKVPLMGRGENVRDWCYVTDHCRAIDMVIHAALTDKSLIGQTFCVGGNSERTNLQVTQQILRILGKDDSWITSVPHRLGHDSRYAIDSQKIKKILGWEPQFSFEEGINLTVQWYKQNERWWKPLLIGRPDIDPQAQKQRKEIHVRK